MPTGEDKPRCTGSAPGSRRAFRNALVRWFAKHGKDYPWRRTTDPHAILVSEVMLQQTQIATVLAKGSFTSFLETFPDTTSLAAADDASLLKAWEGLGYYRRARMLRGTARAVMMDHGGIFPTNERTLMSLPGIGRYTAGALRAFAFGLPAVLVDGNVARVLARVMDFHEPVDLPKSQARLWEWAETLADPARPREYHSALMELGQTLCRPRAPQCAHCPVARFCATRDPAALPVKRTRIRPTDLVEHALWLRDAKGHILLAQAAGARRTGLWQLPLRGATEVADLPLLAESRYTITRYRVTLRVHDGNARRKQIRPDPGETWIPPGETTQLAMAAPFRKVVDQLLPDDGNRM
ncbi:MAG: A/G-specific adenine glycosylase [Verrucomicrobia bacterium]|nr:A/G-specific adenine glycosylase [Verrucomicrobiota bacterium]